MPKRIIGALSAALDDDTEVAQGQEVDLTDAEVKRLDEHRALVPEGFDSFEQWSDHKQYAYRAGRGDLTAAGQLEEARKGGIDVLSTEAEGSAAYYIDWLAASSPTIDEVVAKVEGDPEKAAAMLEAEREVSGGEPRKGVVEGLTKIAEG